MLVGVAFLPPSFLPSRTLAFYIIKRQNCVYFCNTVYDNLTKYFQAFLFLSEMHLGVNWDLKWMTAINEGTAQCNQNQMWWSNLVDSYLT